MHAIATRTFGILHVIQEAAIEATHATGNARKAKTISHTSGFAFEPGASKAIGAPAAAIKKPGTVRMPQTTVATIAKIGRGARSFTVRLLREALPPEKPRNQQCQADRPDEAGYLSDVPHHAAGVGRLRHLAGHDPKECHGSEHKNRTTND